MENLDEMLKNAVENIKHVIDADSIIGKPIVNGDGNLILPVSKLSCGFVVGGGDYPSVVSKRKIDSPDKVAGVSSGGVTITPVGFLVCGKEKRFVAIDKDEHDGKWSDLLKCVINIIGDEDRE